MNGIIDGSIEVQTMQISVDRENFERDFWRTYPDTVNNRWIFKQIQEQWRKEDIENSSY